MTSCSIKLPLINIINHQEFNCTLAIVTDNLETLLNDSLSWLTDKERAYLEGCHDTRKQSFIAGRKAVILASSLDDPHKPIMHIHYGILGYPLLDDYEKQVTIAHCSGYATAILYPHDLKLGVDIEHVSQSSDMLPIDSFLNYDEIKIANSLNIEPNSTKLIMWSAKESLSKAIQCGLSTSFESLSVENVSAVNGVIFKMEFTHFKAFQCFCWLFRDISFCITLPQNITLSSFDHVTQLLDRYIRDN